MTDPTRGPMPAVETPPTPARSATMRAIKGKGTKPELALAAALEAIGFAPDSRNDRSLPGSPDLVFDGPRVAVFVDSKFWHGRGRIPATNRAWWAEKLARNRERDRRADARLRALGWLPWRVDAAFVAHAPEAAAYAAKAICLRRALKMRTIILYWAEGATSLPPGDDYSPVRIRGELVGWIRAELAAPGTTAERALDQAEPRDGESLANTFELERAASDEAATPAPDPNDDPARSAEADEDADADALSRAEAGRQ